MSVKTELEWDYSPVDFFEVQYAGPVAHGELVAAGGKAVVTLAVPTDPVPASLEDSVRGEVAIAFEARQVLVHRAFELQGPIVIQHEADGRRTRAVFLAATAAQMSSAGGELTVGPPDGTVALREAQRLASEAAFVAALVAKRALSPVLSAMVRSYCQAVRDGMPCWHESASSSAATA